MAEELRFEVDAAQIGPALTETTAAIMLGLVQQVAFEDIQLAEYIKANKLSGQVLNARSGNLAESVRPVPVTVSGDDIIGGVQAGGGPIKYAGVHEYGVDHPWTIQVKNARALSFVINGKRIFAMKVTIPGMAERSYMRTGLDDKTADIIAGLKEAVRKAKGVA